ncbi:hypothetical protein GCM10023093_23550 [Nemorincola caseinilytica]|uniref:Uncharacterized protein n=1 Tax=Nemorincola caseinilytica TaxID=2054315 RepID=A0ABP8NLX9_9BACT
MACREQGVRKEAGPANTAAHVMDNEPYPAVHEFAAQAFFRAVSPGSDSVSEHFYTDANDANRMYHIRAGRIFSKRDTAAFRLHTENDTTIIATLYSYQEGFWKETDTIAMHIYRFSPSDLRISYADHDFDGYTDVFINCYTSMGLAQGFGYLLTYSPAERALVLHPETIAIPDLEIDKAARMLVSKTTDRQSTKWMIRYYKWVHDSLQLHSEKTIPIRH